MNEYSASDYGIFTNAIQTANNLKTKLEEGNVKVSECETTIGNEAVFMGPAADSCKEGIQEAKKKLTNESGNISTITNYLKETSANYQKGDSDATKNLLNVNDGEVTVSELSSLKVNGQIIYYNQKGYYDSSGKLQKWQSSWAKDIASSGCGPTSMAACLANMLNDPTITPSTIANMMKANDNIGGKYVNIAANYYGLDQTHSIRLDKNTMNTFLRNNGTMIVAVNGGGHYISVLGIDDSTNPPTYIVCDPNDPNTANKKWTYSDIATGHTMVFHIAPKGKTVQQCLTGGGTAVQV